MKSKNVLFAACGLLAVVAFSLFPNFARKEAREGLPGGSFPAPQFSLDSLSGEKIRLADFRGKVVILDFWATWCPPCQEGIPELNRLQKEYQDQGLVVIGLSLDRGGSDQVRRFLEQKAAEYLNAMGSEEVFQAYSSLPGLGKIQGIPTAFVIDREGRVQKKFVGLTRKQTFEGAIKPLL